ncbi:MAG: twin-arginine translocation signal domain-containing protein [Chitinophagaceae bacterium]
MKDKVSRRKFVQTLAAGGVVLAGTPYLQGYAQNFNEGFNLYHLSKELLQEWGHAVLKLQVTNTSNKDSYGGIISPDNGKIPGRCGDAIYPFFCIAQMNNDNRFAEAAQRLYNWMETNVSDADGAWLNEPQKNAWKGITVFTTIALAETLKHHHAIIDPSFKNAITARIKRSSEYIFKNFNIDYGNINYPVTASYALALTGILLDEPRYKQRGAELAKQALQFIEKKDKLLFGEGQPYYQTSPKGCVPVDLGYNIEESLPSLVQYGLLTGDNELLDTISASMQAHMAFMLPDGGWDNSWGTRIYKWTYWGSRTSDGCQTAFALMKDRDPRFYTVAYKNLQLLKACTKNGLLYGGPHLQSHGIKPNVHHSFCHMKSLANIINYTQPAQMQANELAALPRVTEKGSRFFSSVQTWLLSIGKYRATITGYDREYKDFKNGHPTGGALSMLWHEAVGPILVASMNEYQLYEKDNMQDYTDPFLMPLTGRVELKKGNEMYSNICDLSAQITVDSNDKKIVANVKAKLVNGKQQSPDGKDISCNIHYTFTSDSISIEYSCEGSDNAEGIRLVLPLICKSDEQYILNGDSILIKKNGAAIKVKANKPLQALPVTNGRLFNPVPGMEAVPVAVNGVSGKASISVIKV